MRPQQFAEEDAIVFGILNFVMLASMRPQQFAEEDTPQPRRLHRCMRGFNEASAVR